MSERAASSLPKKLQQPVDESIESIVGGSFEATAYQSDTDRAERLRNSTGNMLHSYADFLLGTGAYWFGSAMHVSSQASAITSASMFVVGSTYFLAGTQRRYGGPDECFKYEAAAGWIWMLSCYQEFQTHKKLKYCGQASWAGLMTLGYFSARYMLDLITGINSFGLNENPWSETPLPKPDAWKLLELGPEEIQQKKEELKKQSGL